MLTAVALKLGCNDIGVSFVSLEDLAIHCPGDIAMIDKIQISIDKGFCYFKSLVLKIWVKTKWTLGLLQSIVW